VYVATPPAEKALVCFPSTRSTSQHFRLLPLSALSPTTSNSHNHFRLLRGLPANLDIGAVYDLIRPWGCLSTLNEGTAVSGRRDWSLEFIKEEDARLWEQEWSGISFEEQML